MQQGPERIKFLLKGELLFPPVIHLLGEYIKRGLSRILLQPVQIVARFSRTI
jgi:hypothetical protein